MKFKHTLHTKGDGFWSRETRAVQVYRISCNNTYYFPEHGGGELRVYFARRSWDVTKHGLIYSDSLFIKELRAALVEAGLYEKVEYSEQGMQGKDYVSFDVQNAFIVQLKHLSPSRW